MRWYQRLVDKVGGILFYTTLAFLLLIAAPVGGLIYIFDRPPVVTIFNSIPSPDGRKLAVIFQVDYGATAPFNRQVSIVPAGRTFSRDRYPSFLAVRGQRDLDVKWVTDQAIEIDLPEGAIIYENDRGVGDITVEYK